MGQPLILIADDQPGVRMLLRELFQQVGYRVALAADGEEAVAMAAAELPDLALVDLKMPGMDGMETLAALHRLAPALPVVIVTAAGAGQSCHLKEQGARAVATKPFDIFWLRNMVQQVLQEEGRV